MTQGYTPTTDEVCECWTTRGDIGNPYETDADVDERHHEESVKFNRWLAAHDAEVRGKALSLTDDELIIAESEYESYIGEYEGDGLGAMSTALKAVAEDRRNRNEYRNR